MTTLQPVAPPALDRLVKRCLAKDPEHRWQTVRDLRFDLQGIAEGVDGGGRSAPPVSRRSVRAYVAGTLALLAVSAALVKDWLPARAPSSPTTAPLMRFVLGLSPSAPVAVEDQSATVLALSPDGARLVYVAKLGNNTQLYARPLDQFQPTPIPGTEGGVGPFFSPDGQRVAFFAGGKLKTVGLDGNAPVTVCDAPTSRGGSWASDDTIVFTPGIGAGLMRVPARGGEPKALLLHISCSRRSLIDGPLCCPTGSGRSSRCGRASEEGKKLDWHWFRSRPASSASCRWKGPAVHTIPERGMSCFIDPIR